MSREEKISINDKTYVTHPAGSGAVQDKITKLLLKTIESFPVRDTLLVECGTGIIAGELESQGCTVTTVDSNYINYLYSQKNCSGDAHFCDFVVSGPSTTFDQILFRVTKSAQYNYTVVNRLLALLNDGGTLFIAGGNKEGIKSVEKRLQQADIPLTVFANGGGGRILQVDAISNRITEEYESLTTAYDFKGATLSVETMPGLFSYGKCDKGTQLLLKHIPGITGKKVLDLGCGSGVLSCAALEKGAASVVATDISATALEATKRNVNDDRCTVIASYIAEGIDEKFDVVLTNPPFHEGQKSNFSIGEEWLKMMRSVVDKRTVVYLVANNFLPYFRMGGAVFENVESIASDNGFTVYKMTGVKYE